MTTEAPLPPVSESTELTGPPWVPVPGIFNFRDLGGHAIKGDSKRSVTTAYIYRCAEPSRVTTQGRDEVKRLQVKKWFDLRSEPELNKTSQLPTVVEFEDSERLFVPVFKTEDYSPEKIAIRFKDYGSGTVEGFTQAYRSILNAGVMAYRTIFTHIRDHPTEPIVIHCTAGKDRTGVVCALILKLADVDDETIGDEYALTTQGLMPMRPIIMSHLKDSDGIQGDLTAAENMLSSRKEAMLSTLKMLENEFGGVEGYLSKYLEFSAQDIAKIKANLIKDKPSTVVLH